MNIITGDYHRMYYFNSPVTYLSITIKQCFSRIIQQLFHFLVCEVKVNTLLIFEDYISHSEATKKFNDVRYGQKER